MDDPAYLNLTFIIIGIIILLLIEIIYTLLRTAVISLKEKDLLDKANTGDKAAIRIRNITRDANTFLNTMFYARIFALMFINAIISVSFVDKLKLFLTRAFPDFSEFLCFILSIIIIVILTTFIIFLFGFLIPEKFAYKRAESIAYKLSGFLKITFLFFKPAVKFINAIANLFAKIFGINVRDNDASVTEEEILMMVDVGEEKGIIENSQKEMINNIFEFDDVEAEDIMTHRTDIVAVEKDVKLQKIVNIAMEKGFSRIPVYDEDIDNIVGIAYIKDLLKYISGTLPKVKKASDIMRSAIYIPQTLKGAKIFNKMRDTHMQMAIVVDEYGGTAGIITLEDLLEAIVGDISDEYDEDSPMIEKIDENIFTLDGTTTLDDIEDLCRIEFPEGDYDTIGGFISYLLGFLPKDGDLNKVTYENLEFTVLKVEERRISKVKLEVLMQNSNENLEEEN